MRDKSACCSSQGDSQRVSNGKGDEEGNVMGSEEENHTARSRPEVAILAHIDFTRVQSIHFRTETPFTCFYRMTFILTGK